ncbi:hypothetical protein [Streptomyces sp. NPDC127105]
MTLTDLKNGFRDDEQRRRVQRVIHDRLVIRDRGFMAAQDNDS